MSRSTEFHLLKLKLLLQTSLRASSRTQITQLMRIDSFLSEQVLALGS